MTEARISDQDGREVTVELERRSAESGGWCSKHAPAKPGLCHIHGIHYQELHDAEITRIYGVDAIFYCPKLGCDDFAWDVRTSHLISADSGCLHHVLDPDSDMSTVVFELFRNAALLRILFLKQRWIADKLELFERER